MYCLTHIHIDRAAATCKLVEKYGALVYVHPRGVKHLINPEKLWRASLEVLKEEAIAIGKPEPIPHDKVVGIKDGECIKLDNEVMCFIYTPGHAPHHQVILWKKREVVFTGDAAGGYVASIDAVLPVSPPPVKIHSYLDSLVKILGLEPRIIAFAHSGVAEEATKLVRRHGAQMVKWLEVSSHICRA